MSDYEQRIAEIESLESIFPDLVDSKSEASISFQFQRDIKLSIKFPDDYPSCSPPIFELSGPYLKPNERQNLHNQLNECFLENMGMPIIYNWVTIINDFITDENEKDAKEKARKAAEEESKCQEIEEEQNCYDVDIKHGEVFHDRKSFFQAHLAVIESKEDVDTVMRILKSNSKIRRATHNILAYRYTKHKDGKEIKCHDCEDDGETGASSKMLELMERMQANNVMVVVTRWYGGIHLGPDRFRHINNLTRQILVDNNYGKKQ